jgi:hypothetical protein
MLARRGSLVFVGRGTRPPFIALAAALAFFSACGKHKTAARIEKPAPPAAGADSPLSDALAGEAADFPKTQPREVPPDWTRERPHFFVRDGRRFASAVAWARTGNVYLARTAAEDSARVELLRLIKGIASGTPVEGALPGARMTDTFTSKIGGEVFVRLEVEAAL